MASPSPPNDKKPQSSPRKGLHTWLDDVRIADQEYRFLAAHDDALDTARLLNAAMHPRRSLSGFKIGLKDNIAIAGVRMAAGLAARADSVADQDAVIVERLRNTGACILPRLNMDEAAFGATAANPHYRTSLNPLEKTRSPGGSSGGAAVGVAAHILDAAFGTDTLGSIRIPASYCGLVGFKPSQGLIPDVGVFPLAPRFDTPGLLAHSVETIITVLKACDFLQNEPSYQSLKPLSELRIAIPTQITEIGCEKTVQNRFDSVITMLSAVGARAEMVAIDQWQPKHLRHAALLMVEVEACRSLADYRGQSSQLSPKLAAALNYGERSSAENKLKAMNQLDTARHTFSRLFDEFDAIVTPTTPQTAFLHNIQAPVNQADFTVIANIIGAPALALPINDRGGDLPSSMQILVKPGNDNFLLVTGMAIEKLLSEYF